ncbi:MAG: hypothetical protein NC177_01355 [Ruminococcus flavefaciens]|nr:hypothetical protein [Ruminococcus flavefaciens]
MYNINQLIHNLDTSIHISRAVKTSIMMQMYFSYWSDFHEINNFSAVFKGIIDRDETETVRKILDEGKLITKRNINTYIKYADKNEHYPVFDMLNEYKEEVLKNDYIFMWVHGLRKVHYRTDSRKETRLRIL